MKMFKQLKTVKGFEDYAVTNDGRVWSWKGKGHWMKLENLKGYLRTSFKKNGKNYHRRVHRLVAETYLDNPDNFPVVEHKNNIKTDNRKENLFWSTQKNNMQNAWNDGLINIHTVGCICVETGDIFNSQVKAAKEFGFSNSSGISRCLAGIDSMAGGYHWKKI